MGTTCSTVQVVSGDSCGSLATECGISAADFTTYNPGSNFCSTLQVGQHVCCSSGSLPDYTPAENADGSCYNYTVVSGDYCAEIAESYSITTDEIESYNNETWGWLGCSNLGIGQNICLSTGSPPLPAPVANAVCGPQVPNTTAHAAGVSLASLNPCALNACCDIWGQCGVTDDFCTVSESATGAPGTAAPGTNGCISNCGTSGIIGAAPETFIKLGYFEGFNFQSRACDNMNASSIPVANYTHIHLAFAEVSSGYTADVSGIAQQFDEFLLLNGVKKILSFGGWSFGTDADSLGIFRLDVSDANRATFIQSLVQLVAEYDIDGLDFDWEYPGATDIPGVPAGDPGDGARYLSFLTNLRAALPNTSISISAPASYYYLRGFPIAAMSKVVDYIVFMTYDLHGQWDYGNPTADPGCPAGNCLRSHVNLTETSSALNIITKAGVPSGQVVVGVSSYGRSFQMSNAGCTGPMCTFTGPTSGATPGACTQTAGVLSNAEINAIIAAGGDITIWEDNDSNYLVYDNTQWVAYMDAANKAARTAIYKAFNFGGTADWAIDLQ